MMQEVKASTVTLTVEQIHAVINEKLENTIYWLNKAYNARPQDSSAEKALLELMAVLQKMKNETNKSFENRSG